MSGMIIGRGAVSGLGERMKEAGCRGRAALVSDENVAALHLDRVKGLLEEAGFETLCHVVGPGEESKSLESYGGLLGFLAAGGFGRSDTMVALGGGVVGDLAGFAAATYMRGMKLVQLPTSLLACVDSSVGGKTGINLEQGKNLAGAFLQPTLTLIDPDFLRSLPSDIYRDGLAEVLKYAAITEGGVWELLPYELDEEEEVIRRCVAIKRGIVSRDELDRGERQLLNFGHSFGHAFEKLSGYSLPHGRAVAMGMCVMARASFKLGLCGEEAASSLIGMAHVLGLPTTAPYREEEIFEALLSDKKRSGERMTLVMFHGIGDCRLADCSMQEVGQALRLGMGA